MKLNLGSTDRIVRLVVGLIVVVVSLTLQSWGLIGLVLIATSAIGFCPLYAPFGLGTCPRKSCRVIAHFFFGGDYLPFFVIDAAALH